MSVKSDLTNRKNIIIRRGWEALICPTRVLSLNQKHVKNIGNEQFFARSRKLRDCTEAYWRYAAHASPKIDAEIAEKGGFPTEGVMYGEDRIYKKVEVIGVSKNGFEAAIQSAVRKAHTTLEKLSWFEVGEIRGHVGEDGEIKEYQVVLKVAFQLKEK